MVTLVGIVADVNVVTHSFPQLGGHIARASDDATITGPASGPNLNINNGQVDLEYYIAGVSDKICFEDKIRHRKVRFQGKPWKPVTVPAPHMIRLGNKVATVGTQNSIHSI